jgi:hypothetical protein
MEKAIIKDLERALRLARDKMITYTNEELIQVCNLLAAATHSANLEVYSREVEALKTKEPELV